METQDIRSLHVQRIFDNGFFTRVRYPILTSRDSTPVMGTSRDPFWTFQLSNYVIFDACLARRVLLPIHPKKRHLSVRDSHAHSKVPFVTWLISFRAILHHAALRARPPLALHDIAAERALPVRGARRRSWCARAGPALAVLECHDARVRQVTARRGDV